VALIGHLQVANKCRVASATLAAASSGPIPKAPGFAGGYLHQPCSRLMTVPGIGPIISSAMVAAIGTGDVFSKGRDFGAWLGLVPKQISTGDRTILGKISRRGNRYLRVLFVQAAWVVLVKIKNWERYGLKSWIEAAKKRLHHNVLAIALANKLARIAWAVLAKGRAFELTRTDDAGVRPA
jgi:transposase